MLKNPKKVVLLFPEKLSCMIRKDSWAENQNIRMVSEGSCDWRLE